MKIIFSGIKWFLVAILIIIIEQAPMLLIKKQQPFWQVLVLTAIFVLIAVLTLYFAKKINLVGNGQKVEVDSAILWIGLAYAALVVVKAFGGIVLYLEHGIHANTANQMALEQAKLPPILLFTLVAVLAPIVEEVVFRGLLFNKIFGLDSCLGLIVSSFLFGALHMPTDLGSWIVYGGMGLVLGFVYHKTKKLEYTMIIHFLNNAIAVIIMILMTTLK
ncbi:CPBP family intramembrane glutamic endopeptidase [Streptococcus catagoni]|uniref:CPBP family intramembrane glutamic endopeptidase n=1 Tax=Streptococcus catagoni TaxID=2654874 RepID=UPI0014076E45|nr:type II CAAX endopeptidase family protein [Streptococcus catagoni]